MYRSIQMQADGSSALESALKDFLLLEKARSAVWV